MNMSILNITNLTDNPEEWIRNKYISAFEEIEKDFDENDPKQATDIEKEKYITSQIEMLEETAEETLGKDLLGLIDNYLVNLDYYAEVKEWYENR